MRPELREDEVARLHDSMADEYDDIRDLWYSWLFARYHVFVARFLAKAQITGTVNCLDVGCGTGFQSILFALCGYDVKGIDISARLLEKAEEKELERYLATDLFTSRFSFVERYSQEIRELASRIRAGRPLVTPTYQCASATDIPFCDNVFDVVSCAGSTLSLIDDYRNALKEIHRVLKPNGVMLLEVENRFNLDLLWALLDGIVRGKIGYDQEIRVSLRNIFAAPSVHVHTDFPFSTHDGEVEMPIWLFSSRGLCSELRHLGLEIRQVHAIHNVTNMLPSVLLDASEPRKGIVHAFRLLAGVETRLSSIYPFNRLGCSLVVFARKAK